MESLESGLPVTSKTIQPGGRRSREGQASSHSSTDSTLHLASASITTQVGRGCKTGPRTRIWMLDWQAESDGTLNAEEWSSEVELRPQKGPFPFHHDSLFSKEDGRRPQLWFALSLCRP